MVDTSFGGAKSFENDEIAALFGVFVGVQMSGEVGNEIIGKDEIYDIRAAFLASRHKLDSYLFAEDTNPLVQYRVHFTIHSGRSKSTA